LINLTDAQILS